MLSVESGGQPGDVKVYTTSGRGLNVENAMPEAEATAFAQKMKGLVLKVRAKNPAPTPAATGTSGRAF